MRKRFSLSDSRWATVCTTIVMTVSSAMAIAQPNITGYWKGSLDVMNQSLAINAEFTDAAHGILDIPAQGAVGLTLIDIRTASDSVFFAFHAGSSIARFEGVVRADSISGAFKQSGFVGRFILKRSEKTVETPDQMVAAQLQSIADKWAGVLDYRGSELDLDLTVYTVKGQLRAKIGIPIQHLTGIPCDSVTFVDGTFHFEMMRGASKGIFNGKLSGDSLVGVLHQAGMDAAVRFIRASKKTQASEAPLPYDQEEIVFHNDTLTLSGTLTLPRSKRKHPCVVLISGSGPQDRDEEIVGFKIFKTIADHLTRNGIAVLRYDDRGTGGSNGSTVQSTSTDFAGDVMAAIRFLSSRSDIDVKKIGLLGHSEGGIVAPLVASRSSEVSFVVLMAGTGVRGDSLLIAQGERIMRADSASEEDIAQVLAANRSLYRLALADSSCVGCKELLMKQTRDGMKKLSAAQLEAIADEDEFVRVAAEQQFETLTSRWFRAFLAHDPAPALERTHCRVLMLFGGLDVQVPAKLNEAAMLAALKRGKNANVFSKTFPKANHLFQEAKTGSPKEYAMLKKSFVPGFLDLITTWIQQQ